MASRNGGDIRIEQDSNVALLTNLDDGCGDRWFRTGVTSMVSAQLYTAYTTDTTLSIMDSGIKRMRVCDHTCIDPVSY